MKKRRAQEVEKAMRLAWASLESHFYGTYNKTPEGTKFHIKCIKEYIDALNALRNLY